ncbi:TPA: flagellar export chaperone FliS [Clostridioides difficile]|nr:flagellar export chaperone FliS [Clostridioides difficile]HBG5090456.1 flagellar export chaperone FliS [Clostridioides difficile]HBG5212994.1 flagellar export chaperone FliS [Clostridioides difficile]HBG5248606.1 flagellar export chaperone FliS [Clostridioides difficile]HBG5531023.1 flagellar export chaperone FliS [Clostridioides difficile]
MYGENPYNSYKQNAVFMASKEQLLLMLVDGAVKYTKIARAAILDKNTQKAHRELVRVQDIFTELMTTLDQNAGQWAKDMYKVYEFIKSELAIADENKDIKIIDDILPIVKQIRDTWHEVYNQLKI